MCTLARVPQRTRTTTTRVGWWVLAASLVFAAGCSGNVLSSGDGGSGGGSGAGAEGGGGTAGGGTAGGGAAGGGTAGGGTAGGGTAGGGTAGGGGVNPTGPSAAAGHTWQMAFQDEFDDSTGMSGPVNGLQASKWNSGWYTSGINASSPPVQSTEAEWYGPLGIVFPGDGAVHLRLSGNHSNTFNKDYVSGCITTAGHQSISPSTRRTVVEARLKVAGPQSVSAGYWPAFWLLSHLDGPGGTGQWPPEIDIFEFFGNANAPLAHLHTTGTDINKGYADSDGVTDLSLAFHVYTLDLSATALTFYLDGVQKWSHTNATQLGNLFAFDPMYALLNFQFGGYAGSPTGAVPNDMAVDYYRTWQQSP